jgi:hypothetical protein
MNYSRDPSHAADMATHLERPEQHVHPSSAASRPWRDSPPPPSEYREPFDRPEGAAALRARNRHPGISPWLFVMATALNTMVAAVLAVIITLGVVRQERTDGPGREAALAAYARSAGGVGGEQTQPVQPSQQTQPAPPNPAPLAVDLRPIGSPGQPLLLEAQKPARLPLQISPEEATREPFILALVGAPAGMTLSGADRIGSDTWFVSPGSANRLEITVPEWSTTVFEVTVALRRMNGLVAAQAKAWIAAPPPASPQTAQPKADANAAKDLLAKGDRLLEKGDIVAARAMYQRAAEMGSGTAALTLGATYDPNRLWSLGALGMVGNKERARQWYARASELGQPEAKARLTALGN